TGGCHCGRVRFEVDTPADIEAVDCNCRVCAASGYLHLIVPKSRFRLLAGEEALTDYRFGTGVAVHRFCSICGVKSFYVPRSIPDGIAVDLRCVSPRLVRSLTVSTFDGSDSREGDAGALPHLYVDGSPTSTGVRAVARSSLRKGRR